MNITEMLGAPIDDPTDFETSAPSACGPSASLDMSSQPQQRRNLLLTAALVAAALAIGSGAGWYFASRIGGDATPSVAVAPTAVMPAPIGGFAEMFTALYLSGVASPQDLSSMYIGTAPSDTGIWVNQSAALDTQPLGDGFWEVTVAVDTLELTEGGYEPAGIQFFEVIVSEQDPYPVAVSAPSRIPAPVAASGISVPTFADSVPADQTDPITHFINGYLTGQEDIARYVTSTARIQLFAQPPYESISITSMASDAMGNALVAVTATTRRGAVHMLEYALELSFDAGIWEVSNLTSKVGTR